jgi:hypothetical protein
VDEDRTDLEDAAIAGFWAWWADAGRALATDDASPGGFSSGALPVVQGLDEALATGVRVGVFTGGAAARTIVLMYDADPDGRALGERWLSGAPAADAEVDFAVFPPAVVDR